MAHEGHEHEHQGYPHEHEHEHGHEHEHEHGHEHEQAAPSGAEDAGVVGPGAAHVHVHVHGSHEHLPVHAHHLDHHGHGHAHGHDHAHGAHGTWREDLPANAGHGKVLFLDAPSGLAGDMIIAALVDLGVPPHIVEESVAALGLRGFHLHVGTRTRSGIVATSFDVHVDEAQPERTYAEVRAILEGAPLTPGVKRRAQRTFLRLAQAEAKVHRASLDDVHFHEVGAVDALVDVVGSAAALEHLGADLVVSPLPMGRGFVKARHGVLPLPAPATVECLAGLPTYDGGIDFEFVTPTGAAIVGAQASGAARWPSLRPERVGWGAGTANLRDRPNLLRAVLGAREAAAEASDGAAQGTHVVLEANVDDATGELLAACIQACLEAGAVDAWATPIVMKKGRPAVTLTALAPLAAEQATTMALLRESTSLGVRRHVVSRTERPRRLVEVETRFGRLPIKVAEGPYGPAQVKPEFDACAKAAREHGAPVRVVVAEALRAGLALLE